LRRRRKQKGNFKGGDNYKVFLVGKKSPRQKQTWFFIMIERKNTRGDWGEPSQPHLLEGDVGDNAGILPGKREGLVTIIMKAGSPP